MTFTDSREANGTKGAVHGAALTLFALMSVYNGCAWYRRRERHLAANAWLYGLGCCYEVYQVKRHCR